jgi:nitrate reductase gamma subunit
MNAVTTFLYGYYPYICLTVFVAGSLIRFDRDQYTWKSDSSQLLSGRGMRMASNCFHVGILFLLFGHTVGLLTPHWLYEHFITAPQKQLLAVISGGLAGSLCFIGLTMLLHRRLTAPRVRATSKPMDVAILLILWVQLVLGLVTLPFSLHHADGGVMLQLSDWVQRIVTFRAGAGDVLTGVPLVYLLHLALGMTIFLLFPFSRLVHVWSGFAALSYLARPYQVVRARRLNVPAGHGAPRSAGSGD